MKKRQAPLPPSPHPYCRLCRDGTYATMSLKTFPDGDCEWYHYCDPCGNAMASVVRDGQKRDPESQRLPDPPKGTSEAAPESAREKKAPAASVKAPVAAARPVVKTPEAPPPPARKTAPAKNTGGHDLLALLGMK